MNVRTSDLRLPFSILAITLMLTSCGTAPKKQTGDAPPDPAPEITQFYATEPTIPRGGRSLLCYSTSAADQVSLTPPDAVVAPSPSRCVEVSPTVTTTYTLNASKGSRKAASHSLVVHVGAAVIPPPQFLDTSISATKAKPGDLIAFCFKASGADSVDGSPGQFQKGGQVAGDCLVHQPRETTRYTLTLHGPGGTKSQSITVTVAP